MRQQVDIILQLKWDEPVSVFTAADTIQLTSILRLENEYRLNISNTSR